jgi:hypothetical protein
MQCRSGAPPSPHARVSSLHQAHPRYRGNAARQLTLSRVPRSARHTNAAPTRPPAALDIFVASERAANGF